MQKTFRVFLKPVFVSPSPSTLSIHRLEPGYILNSIHSASFSTCAPGAPSIIKVPPASIAQRPLSRKAILTLRPAAINKLRTINSNENTIIVDTVNADSTTTSENLKHLSLDTCSIQNADKKTSEMYLKISVRNKGCSGAAYSLDYTTEKGKFDEVVEQDGVKILIDAKALLTLIGSELDYVHDPLSSQFVFYNPNVKETCGCGLSFTV
jgi:iron-sulfur cluster assembly 1